MLNAAAQHAHEVNAFLHLGDGINDAGKLREVFPHIPLYLLPGNCDYSYNQPNEGLEWFGSTPFFYTHGHSYGVKEDLGQL